MLYDQYTRLVYDKHEGYHLKYELPQKGNTYITPKYYYRRFHSKVTGKSFVLQHNRTNNTLSFYESRYNMSENSFLYHLINNNFELYNTKSILHNDWGDATSLIRKKRYQWDSTSNKYRIFKQTRVQFPSVWDEYIRPQKAPALNPPTPNVKKSVPNLTRLFKNILNIISK